MLTTVERLVFLREARLLKGLPSEELFLLNQIADEVILSGGEVLFREGDFGDVMYVVVSGQVRISRNTPEGEHVVTRLGRGEVLGELAIFSEELRSATATAEGDGVQLLAFRGDAVTQIVLAHPSIAMSFLAEMADRVRATTRAAAELGARGNREA